VSMTGTSGRVEMITAEEKAARCSRPMRPGCRCRWWLAGAWHCIELTVGIVARLMRRWQRNFTEACCAPVRPCRGRSIRGADLDVRAWGVLDRFELAVARMARRHLAAGVL
jgi:hypothetical protein